MRPVLLLIGTVSLILGFPPKGRNPQYRTIEETAIALSEKAPGGVLMGGYWQTYVLTSLQRHNAMTPVPLEGQPNRTPWTPGFVRHASHVIVEYRQSKLGDPELPPQSLYEYGNRLLLLDPKWLDKGEYAFALYANQSKDPFLR